MNETYVEWMVKKPMTAGARTLKAVLLAVTVGFVAVTVLFGSLLSLVFAAVCGVATYFVGMYMDIEYEYLYMGNEITIDKVLAKTKRKNAAVYDINKMEMLAPLNSHRLDMYKNREMKTVDYSSGVERQPEQRFMMIYEGSQRVILEPNTEIVKAIQTIAPRKVFTD